MDIASIGGRKVLLICDDFLLRTRGLYLNTETASKISEALLRDWLEFSVPEKVIHDLGPGFVSMIFQNLLQKLNVEPKVVPREAHWPNVAERAIDRIRRITEKKLAEDKEILFEDALRVAEHTL